MFCGKTHVHQTTCGSFFPSAMVAFNTYMGDISIHIGPRIFVAPVKIAWRYGLEPHLLTDLACNWPSRQRVGKQVAWDWLSLANGLLRIASWFLQLTSPIECCALRIRYADELQCLQREWFVGRLTILGKSLQGEWLAIVGLVLLRNNAIVSTYINSNFCLALRVSWVSIVVWNCTCMFPKPWFTKMQPPSYISLSFIFPADVHNRPFVLQMKWSTETCWPGNRSSFFKFPTLSRTVDELLLRTGWHFYLPYWHAAHRESCNRQCASASELPSCRGHHFSSTTVFFESWHVQVHDAIATIPFGVHPNFDWWHWLCWW